MSKFQGMKFTAILLALSSSILANNLKIKKITYGKSLQNRKLKSYVIGFKNVTAKKVIILTEGTHGNEYIGFTEKLITQIKQKNIGTGFKSFFQSGGALIITPKLNVDGVATKTRRNQAGLDLNREFYLSSKKNNEATSYITHIKDYLSLHKLTPLFAVDYHCCGGKALRPTIKRDSFFYDYFQSSMQHFLGKSYKVINTKELFGKVFKGTLKDFFSDNFNIPAVTFEAKSLEKNSLHQQENLLDNILGYFSNGQQQLAAYNQVKNTPVLSTREFKSLAKNYSE